MKKSTKIIICILVAVAVAVISAFMVPFVWSLRDPENQLKFETFVDSLGVFGILFMFFIQVLQTVVAIIPGEPIELIMGLMYGTVGGLFISLCGTAAGGIIIFLCVKKFGMKFVNKFINSDGFSKYSFLKDPKKREFMIFILFFIPGTPKDILTYFAPFTGIALPRFLLISTLARIPSVVSSTYIGSSVSDGELVKSIIIFAVTGLVGLGGIFIHDKIINYKKRKNSDNG